MADILLVDDDTLLREVMQQLLEQDGHRVRGADDGAQALQLLATQPADLVITDVLMPCHDAAGFIMALRRGRSMVPVIAISGGRRLLAPALDLETAGLAGASVQLPKPFGRAALQAAVRQALPA